MNRGDERVAEPPVTGIRDLGQAVRAGRGVSRNQRPPLAASLAGRDRERRRAAGPHRRGGDPLDPGQRRRLAGQRAQECLHGRGRSLDLGEYPVHVVADQPAEPEAGRQRVHERPEADSLDDALDPDRRPDALAHPPSLATRDSRRTCPAPAGPVPPAAVAGTVRPGHDRG